MFTKHLGRTVISIDFSGFQDQDVKLFFRYCELWFQMSNKSATDPENHLLSILEDNSVALHEQSETISAKWISLLKIDPIWETLLIESPFKLSIQKVF